MITILMVLLSGSSSFAMGRAPIDEGFPPAWRDASGLRWVVGPDDVRQAEAKRYCTRTADGKKTGWRLPSRKELRRIWSQRGLPVDVESRGVWTREESYYMDVPTGDVLWTTYRTHGTLCVR